jgi:hypothetical protein
MQSEPSFGDHISPAIDQRGGLLSSSWSDKHCFRSLGKLVVGNLDRIADVDNVGY